MAQPLKEILFQPKFFSDLVAEIKKQYAPFDGMAYLKAVFDDSWESLELKARMIQATRALEPYLPQEYVVALEILVPVSQKFTGFDAILFCQFVEEFGLEYFDESMKALEVMTVDATAEGAVRPFIKRYPQKSMEQMLKWSKHSNEHVRRLASEGCRPLLPWNMRLHQFIKDPSPIIPILENLKDDPSEYVRKSVANNLNDISKHHPDLVVELASKWYGQTNNTDRILKHGLRTLLKERNSKALKIFGFDDATGVEIKKLSVIPKKISIGAKALLEFNLILESDRAKLVRLEYAVHYVKANGSHSSKVFQIIEKQFLPQKIHYIKRKLTFRNMTTRKHYPGTHYLEVIANGKILSKLSFILDS